MHNKTEMVHISTLQQGDTVIVDGKMETVSRHKISNGFTGWCYDGQPYYKTNGMIEVALFPKRFQGKITGWHRQV